MANNNNLNIVIKVIDHATKKLQEVDKLVKKLGNTSEKTAEKAEKLGKSNLKKLNNNLIFKSLKDHDRLSVDSANKKINHEKAVLFHKTAMNQQWLKNYNNSEKERQNFLKSEATSSQKFQKAIDTAKFKQVEANKKSEILQDRKVLQFRQNINKQQLREAEKQAKADKAREASVLAFKKAMNQQQLKEFNQQEKEKARIQKNRQKEEERQTKNQQRSQKTSISKGVKQSEFDFTAFNRTLFTTMAFVGTFTKLFGALGNRLEEGANLDRLKNQFSRVFGTSGTMGSEISKFTTTAVDEMVAMQEALNMGNAGVVQNQSQAAEIIAKAATASKMANVDTATGIHEVTEALKSGSLANLEHLNIIKTNDPELKQRMHMLEKYTGIMSPAIIAQEKYNIILQALTRHTKGEMFAATDLADIMTIVGSQFKILSGTVGSFLGKAIGPLVVKIGILANKFYIFLEQAKQNKTLVEFTKNLMVVGSTVTAIIAVLGTLRLGMMLLGGSLGGLGSFITIFGGLALALTDMTDTISSIASIVKTVSAFFSGITQLVSSFLLDSENYSSGIMKMSKVTSDYLKSIKIGETDLKVIVENISRGLIVAFKFIIDIIKSVKEELIEISESPLFKKIFKNSTSEAWSRSWIDSVNQVREAFVQSAKIIAGAWAISKLLPALSLTGKGGGLAGILAKLPMLGMGAAAAHSIYKSGQEEPEAGYETHFARGAGAAGAVSLGVMGATLGSALFPGLGTLVGAIAGAAVGWFGVGNLVESLLEPEKHTSNTPFDMLKSSAINNEELIKQYEQQKDSVEKQITALEQTQEQLVYVDKDLINLTSELQNLKQSQTDLIIKLGSLSDSTESLTSILSPWAQSVMTTLGPTGETQIAPGVQKVAGENIVTNIPSFPTPIAPMAETSQQQVIDMLSATQKTLEGDRAIKFASLVKEAQKEDKEGEKKITPEEWIQIYTEAMNKSKVAENTKPKNVPKNKTKC